MRILSRISFLALAVLLPALSGCCLVDEDLSDCGGEIVLNYQMCLISNMDSEIETVLKDDAPAAQALRDHLQGVFSDVAHDLDLSFYSSEEGMPRKIHLQDVIDASQAQYVVHMPEKEYMNTGIANIQGNGLVIVQDTLFCSEAKLSLEPGEIVPSQKTGIFTSRLPTKITDSDSQNFNSSLYMANCATALVLDTEKAGDIVKIEIRATGFADRFDIADSTYHFITNYYVKPDEVPVGQQNRLCFVCVTLPSRDSAPGNTADGKNFIWEWIVRVTLPDGSVTESVLGVTEPLQAGQLKVIKAKVFDSGVVSVEDPQIAVSVTLNWNEGGHHEIDL